MANAGLTIDGIFGQDKDRIGIGYTWSDPADQSLDDQGDNRCILSRAGDAGDPNRPNTFQVVFDPVRNPDENTVYVWGIRTRIEF